MNTYKTQDRPYPIWIPKGRKNQYYSGISTTFMGRDALGSILKELQPKKVLIPAYNCDEVVNEFSKLPCEIFYYDLHRDFTINADDILAKIREERIDLFYYIVYFGMRSLNSDICHTIKSHFPDVMVVEDRAHYLSNEINFTYYDAVVYSFRKLIPIMEGGGYVTKMQNPPIYGKRMMANIIPCLMYLKKKLLGYNDQYNRTSLTKKKPGENPMPMSWLSKNVLARYDYNKEIIFRKQCYKEWLIRLKNIRIEPVFPEISEEDIPQGCPIYINDPAKLQHYLQRKNYYVRRHWKLKEEMSDIAPISYCISGKTITLPIYRGITNKIQDEIAGLLLEYNKVITNE